MLERYHKLVTSIACVLLKVVSSTIDYADLQLLNDVICCLLPFKNATKKLSGSNYATISLIIPTTTKLVMELKTKNSVHPAAAVLRDLLHYSGSIIDFYYLKKINYVVWPPF